MTKKKKSTKPSSPAPGRTATASRSPRALLWLLLLIPAGLAAWYFYNRNPQIAAGACKDCNVLLITLDTVRADRLPLYGYDRVSTPSIDKLAGDAYVFEDAISQVPLTLPAHTSILTGRIPPAHGVRDNAGFYLAPEETTLAEMYRSAGYQTAAFVSASVLEARWQLNQGFETYDDSFQLKASEHAGPQDLQRRAVDTAQLAENWLQQHATGKHFVWVHFYDPHDPYEPPEPYRTQYAENPYDGEIAYTDLAIGSLISKLESLQLLDRTIIVITGDHGESLGEHGEPTHGMFLYNATQHVPLILRIPGAGKGRIQGTVRHIDLAPTILDLTGQSTPAAIQGKSLLPVINGKESEKRVAYSESLYAELHYGWSPMTSLANTDYRYIRAPRPELFDRRKDPGDTNNLAKSDAKIAGVLEDRLKEYEQQFSSNRSATPQQIDPETEEKLRALGYIGATVASTEESRRIDPKDKTDVARRVQEASSMLNRQMYERALQEILPVLQSDPEILDAHTVAALAYFRMGRNNEAIDAYLTALKLQPSDTNTMYNLAFAYDTAGKRADAEFWYLKVIEANPSNVYANLKLAHLYRTSSEPLKAIPYFLSAAQSYEKQLADMQDDSGKLMLHGALAEIYLLAGEARRAESHYVAAVELSAGNPALSGDPFISLGLLYGRMGMPDRQIGVFRRMLQSRPEDPRGYFYLGKAILDSRGDLSEAISLGQRGLELRPPADLQVFGHYLLGEAFQLAGRMADSQREYTIARDLEKTLPPR